MKNILSVIIALFALIVTGCTKEFPQEENEPRTVVVSVNMESPEDTRVSLTSTATTPHGLSLQWEEGDKLMLCFEHNFSNFYHNDAPMVPGSIRNGGKVADFIITIPTEIPDDAKFNLYAVYQKTDGDDTNGGYFKPGTREYVFEDYESLCITLNQPGYIPRPMLYFSKKNITKTANPDIGTITLNHSGWILAYHLKNSTGLTIGYPWYMSLYSEQSWVANGQGTNDGLRFNFFNNKFQGGGGGTLNLNINSPYYPQAPYFSAQLPNGGVVTFYRWWQLANLLHYKQNHVLIIQFQNQGNLLISV